ncbi:MAG: NAD-dependent epimerase/dehydratase family protein [Magnetococcales bacterium]|nr:NAD-dependent epimerase/dehydratase family protein [Magnetococcales bacterium]
MAVVFVTGGGGFVGRHLVTRLLEAGHEVRVLVRDPARVPAEARAVVGDLLAPESYRQALTGCTTVFHAAATIAFRASALPEALRVNVEGTRALVDAADAAGVSRFIHLSACAVHGTSATPDVLLDESSPRVATPAHPYAWSKQLAEVLLEERKERLDIRIARFTTVYGPGDARMNSGSIIRSVQRGMRAVPPGGSSFIDVGDLIDGLLAITEKGRSGESYILNGGNLTYRELTQRIALLLEVSPPSLVVPRMARGPLRALAWASTRLRRADPDAVELLTPAIVDEVFRYKYFSAAKAERELAWQPRRTLAESVAAALAWYRQRGMVS